VSWAAFSIVEVMSQTRFAHKRVGYLAANQVWENLSLIDVLFTIKAFSNLNKSFVIIVLYRINRRNSADNKFV
jgi:hypothetical protein